METRDEVKKKNLCLCEGLQMKEDICMTEQSMALQESSVVLWVLYVAQLDPDNWAEIFIKSQFEQLTVSPRPSEQSSLCAGWIDVHLKEWAPATTTDSQYFTM